MFLILRVAALLLMMAAAAASRGQDPGPVRILIIGNSLTFANDLPAMVEAIARSSGAPALRCTAVAMPGFGLQEHWEHGEALRMLRRGGWTHVVLQQGPSSLPESRRILIEYARRFEPVIRSTSASILLYGVWPSADRVHAVDAVTASYAAAAEAVNGTLVPAGAAWQQIWRADPSVALYGPDRFHPSPLGTYVAALMLFEAVTGSRPASLPAAAKRREPALRAISATSDQLAIVQAAAAAANREDRRR